MRVPACLPCCQNDLAEVWSLLNFLHPTIFDSGCHWAPPPLHGSPTHAHIAAAAAAAADLSAHVLGTCVCSWCGGARARMLCVCVCACVSGGGASAVDWCSVHTELRSNHDFEEWFNAPFAGVHNSESIEMNQEEKLLVIDRLHKVPPPPAANSRRPHTHSYAHPLHPL